MRTYDQVIAKKHIQLIFKQSQAEAQKWSMRRRKEEVHLGICNYHFQTIYPLFSILIQILFNIKMPLTMPLSPFGLIVCLKHSYENLLYNELSPFTIVNLVQAAKFLLLTTLSHLPLPFWFIVILSLKLSLMNHFPYKHILLIRESQLSSLQHNH